MSDQHTQQGQIERAKRLREQIEGLKKGRRAEPLGNSESLREQIDERAKQARERDESHEPLGPP